MNNARRILARLPYKKFLNIRYNQIFHFSNRTFCSASNLLNHRDDFDIDIDEKFGIESIYTKLDSKSRDFEKEDDDQSEVFGTLSEKLNDPKFNMGLLNTKFDERIKSEFIKGSIQQESNQKLKLNLKNIELISERKSEFPPNYYYTKIKEYAKNNQIEQALKVFYNDMIQKDKIRPSLWSFLLVIKICSRSGHVNETIKLFDMIKQSGLANFSSSTMYRIITLMYLAISKINEKENGLRVLKEFESFLSENNFEPSLITYSAMIFCYSKIYNFSESLKLVEELKKKELKLNNSIFSNLLCAALNEKRGGFRHALEVWKLLLENQLQPTIYDYNLMLRAARSSTYYKENRQHLKEFKQLPVTDFDNKIEIEPTAELINTQTDVINNDEVLQLNEANVKVIDDLQVIGQSISRKIQDLEWWQKIDENIDKDELLEPLKVAKNQPVQYTNIYKDISPLCSKKFDVNQIQLIKDSSNERLKILGGVKGVYESMRFHKVNPDVKTFMLLLECAENTAEIDRNVLDTLEKDKIHYDLDLLNELLRRSVARNDKNAKTVN